MTLPRVTIVVTTYFPEDQSVGLLRLGAAAIAVGSWAHKLRYDGELAFHVADDGSALFEGRLLLDERRIRYEWEMQTDRPQPPISFSSQQRHGVGASLNAGFDVAHADDGIALYLVDDWQLLAPFDITPWVQLLLDDESVGMVRLGPPHPWLTGTVEAFPSGWGLRLDRHHYAFGHRPALYHPRMRNAYGRFDEDVNAYDCERLYAERWASDTLNERPGIVLALPKMWEHIDSVELAGIDPRA